MAFRTWAKLSGITVGAAALAAASQLGLAYGLGIVRLTRVIDVTARDQWIAQLAWVSWIAMIAAVAGGLAGRLHLPPRSGAGTRIMTAVAAGFGAAVTVPLTMQPARAARVAGVNEVFVIGACAGLGALVGVFAAYAAVSRMVARWSLITVGTGIWVIAVGSVIPSLLPGGDETSARLGVLDTALLDDSVTQRTALFTMPVLALIAGLTHGLLARRRDLPIFTIALSGLAGPALLTVAYLIAGPGGGEDRYQVVPYWAAMTAAGAGVLGSVLAAVIGGRTPAPSDTATAAGSNNPANQGNPTNAPNPNNLANPGSPANLSNPANQAGPNGLGGPANLGGPADDGKNDKKGRKGRKAGRNAAAPTAPPTPDRPTLPKREAQTESAIALAAASAAQRPEEQLRPSDTGVMTSPFHGFTPSNPAPPAQGQGTSGPTAQGQEMPGQPGQGPAMPGMSGQGPAMHGPTAQGTARVEPQQVSPPLPHPTPVSPPPTAPPPAGPPAAAFGGNPAPAPRGRGRQPEQDGDFVDWVSGLGKQ